MQNLDVSGAMKESLVDTCLHANDLGMALYGAISLSCLRKHGQEKTAEIELLIGRYHQEAHFLDGIAKLDLWQEPTDAIRCAKYHYLSNSLGGLDMEYVEESPTKVWIRYRAPYWTFDSYAMPGTGLCAVSPEFSEAAFSTWHGNNGILLDNRRLAFVQTQNAADGDPWDAGYFIEFDDDIPVDSRYRRTVGEWGPRFEAELAPRLPKAWDSTERRVRSARNYGVNWLSSKLAMAVKVLGVEDASDVIAHAFATTLAQRNRSLFERLGIPRPRTVADAATLFARLQQTMGEDVTVEIHGDTATLHQTSTRLLRDSGPLPTQVDAAITRGWQVLLRLCDMNLRIEMLKSVNAGDDHYEWSFFTQTD